MTSDSIITPRKRYAVVGAGGRSQMFIDAVVNTYREYCQLVGLCDLSPTRMNWHNQRIVQRWNAAPVATYPAENFETMISEAQPDVVIVTSKDSTHHQYIVRAMELGCDVICEKPMTIDAPKTKEILNAVERTRRQLVIAFNYRYAPYATKVKELVANGAIGQPTHVDFSWMLNTSHGADYFRRWHASKADSGGLLVHKSTHHFDLVNWWIDSRPRQVFAMGGLRFYGLRNAEARGIKVGYDRYTGHVAAKNDPFALFLDEDPNLRALYLEAEKDSGYIRDKNVFGKHIDIEDTMSVMVRYENQVVLNYSLVAYNPFEGFRASILGTGGRLELLAQMESHIIGKQIDEKPAIAEDARNRLEIRVYPMFGRSYNVEIPKPPPHSHSGADPLLAEQLFSPNPRPDVYGWRASHLDGAASIMVGICANRSLESGLPVDCCEVLPLEKGSA